MVSTQKRFLNWAAALVVAGAFVACDDDDPDPADPMCLADPDTTIEGRSVPLAMSEFLNAFDPTDTMSYDPDAPESLPGPVMAAVWGDRSTGAHGTLGVFPPGFSAPLHTHTDDYHGVVLRGMMTNPFGTNLDTFLDADNTNNHGSVILESGSYWYVPAGSQHSTTCVGPEVCWFYFHSENAFDFAPIVDETGALQPGVTLEAPHADSVLLMAGDRQFAGEPDSFVQFAPAWGDMSRSEHGTFGLFNAGAASPTHIHGDTYYGVVIAGNLTNPFNGEASPRVLNVAGYWEVPAESVHVTACAFGTNCDFYFHSRAAFDFLPVCE